MLKTHILHYQKLTDRKKHIEDQLEKQNIQDYSFIIDFDKEQLTKDIIDKYYINDKATTDKHSNVTLKHSMSPYSVYRELSLASISLCIKHIKSLELFLESDYDELLVLEDDCNFYENSITLNDVISDAPSDWDIIFIGGAFSHNILPVKQIFNGYILSGHPATNTTSSLIYNKKSAQKTLDTIVPFALPIDWHLNHIFHLNNFNVYHTYPYLCNQLSNISFSGTIER